MDQGSKAEIKVTFFKIIPITLLAGAAVFGLRYCANEYAGYHLSNFIYLGLFTILFVVINKHYLKKIRKTHLAFVPLTLDGNIIESFEQRLGELASRHALTVTQAGDGWLIDLPQRDSLTCQLSIGSEAFEWYAAFMDSADGREVMSDWMDYLGYEQRQVEDLVRDKLRDLTWFIEAWLSATELRVTRASKSMGSDGTTIVEWNHQNQWEPIQLNDPSR